MGISATSIVPMKQSHVRACNAIAAASEPWKTLRESIDFARYITLKQAFVCILENAPAGFVIFTPEPVFARGGYLRAIGVAENQRRSGLGKQLLSFAENRTRRSSANMFLCVSSFNRPGQHFYKSMGYTKVGAVPGLISPASSEHIYWKKLTSGG